MAAEQVRHRGRPPSLTVAQASSLSSSIPHPHGLQFLVFLLTAVLLIPTARAAEPWAKDLVTTPGTFPPIRPFSGEFRFGWSGLEAARAKARFTQSGDRITINVEGGTSGPARTLWKVDATHHSDFLAPGFLPLAFEQTEKYAKRTITTRGEYRGGQLWRFREVKPDPKSTAKWKHIKVSPIRDMVPAMFLIRSQALADGDTVRVTVCPGDAPFLVTMRVRGRETLKVGGVERKAIRLGFEIQRINVQKNAPDLLEPHGKFHRGAVWLSDDADRIPLRAEVDIFIGFVFGELVKVDY